MGKLVWGLILLVAVWGGWWLFAASGLQREITGWAEARRLAGWRADIAQVNKTGFPLRIGARVIDIAVADPISGVAVGLAQITITTPVYWPGYVAVALPNTPVTLVTPLASATVRANDARADLRLRPGPALVLQSMVFQAGAWELRTAAGDLLSADDLTLSLRQTQPGSPVYDLSAVVTALAPGDTLRDNLGLGADWPALFDAFTAEMRVGFDRVWDRSALERDRPQPRTIDLTRAEVVWGDLSLSASGALVIDDTGRATGKVAVRAENWPALLDMTQNTGVLAPTARPQVEQVLKALSQMTGQTTGFDVTIDITDGAMAMGFIPLGQAPLIRLP